MLDENKIKSIKNEIEQIAIEHLNARDADTALDHYSNDVIAVSNLDVFPSKKHLSSHVINYYSSLKNVGYAKWEDTLINVISEEVA